MKVSIVIPVYNVEKYIERCFNSVCRQTYSNALIECIFVDDCGLDNSVIILQNLIEDYKGLIDFKLVNHSENKGLSEARNTGTECATGDYVYYFDSDDEITDDCIQSLVKLASSYKGVDIVWGSADIIYEHGRGEAYLIKDEINEFSDNQLWLKKAILKRTYLPVTAWNKLIRIGFLRENKLFFKPGIIHEDEHWEFFVAKCIQSSAFCKKITYKHYINEGSIITTASPKQIKHLLIIIEDFLNHIDPVLKKNQFKSIYYLAFFTLIKTFDCHEKKFFFQVKNSIKQLFVSRLHTAFKKVNVLEIMIVGFYFLPMALLSTLKSTHIRNLYYGLLRLY
nr:glycosyltransferase [uncultured Carboxylicivirga sp.]